MAIMVMNFEVDDYDTWKAMFDEDPVGRRDAGATGHVVSRAVDNPNEGFIRVDFPSVEQAKAFRERLIASGVLERGGMRLKAGQRSPRWTTKPPTNDKVNRWRSLAATGRSDR